MEVRGSIPPGGSINYERFIMKIAFCSDLHLEFGPVEIENTENADVLIIAGDIIPAHYIKSLNKVISGDFHGVNKSAIDFRIFLNDINSKFKDIIIILGNHEFYHGKWYETIDIMREEYSKYSNVHFLEDDSIVINDIIFTGSTIWTNMNNIDPVTLQYIPNMMNDFRLIKNEMKGYKALKPMETVIRHKNSMCYIREIVEFNNMNQHVIITHHAPHSLSINKEYSDDFCMNGAYQSDLSDFILDNYDIKYWFHGHMHSQNDYMIGNTRILSNPRGYINHQECANNFKLKYVEI